jgi:hypothetical protein
MLRCINSLLGKIIYVFIEDHLKNFREVAQYRNGLLIKDGSPFLRTGQIRDSFQRSGNTEHFRIKLNIINNGSVKAEPQSLTTKLGI